MEQTRIEQFFRMAFKDPLLVAKMQQGPGGPENFIGNAVKIGKEHGYEFSAMEATAWIETQQKAMAPGELSNAQLEAVAGGGISSLGSNDTLQMSQLQTTSQAQTSQQEASQLISSILKAMHDAAHLTISTMRG